MEQNLTASLSYKQNTQNTYKNIKYNKFRISLLSCSEINYKVVLQTNLRAMTEDREEDSRKVKSSPLLMTDSAEHVITC